MKRAQPISKAAPIPLKGPDLSLRQERQHVDWAQARLHLRRLPQRHGARTVGLGPNSIENLWLEFWPELFSWCREFQNKTQVIFNPKQELIFF